MEGVLLMGAMTAFAPFREWTDAALKEALVIEKFEDG